MIKSITTLALLSILVFLIFTLNRRCNLVMKNNIEVKSHTDSITNKIDSLTSEIFARDLQIGRYEIFLNRVNEELDSVTINRINSILLQTE